MMSLKDLSDGNTGQVVEAIVVKEVKPVVIIIHDGKTLGVVLVAEDPDRKYTKGGQGRPWQESRSREILEEKWLTVFSLELEK